ncbi:hypothetical protein [Streptomyces sp. NPDC050428]|uniref:hypothetical protein n=1 Tax=Streptomyces sp. NPDC050428 TaxID=3155757 RepID=UPI0034276417
MRTVLRAKAVRCAFAAPSPATARLATATLRVSQLAGPAAALAPTASAVDDGVPAPAPRAEARGRGRVLVAGLPVGSDYLRATLPFTSRAHAAVPDLYDLLNQGQEISLNEHTLSLGSGSPRATSC